MESRDSNAVDSPKALDKKLMSGRFDRGSPTPSRQSRDSPPPALLVDTKHCLQTGVSLEDLSNPPTADELARYRDVEPALLPAKYKRDTGRRIFVNRDLRLDKIKFYGFDMDYTLAVYYSPAYEELAYRLVVDRLVQSGYPESIRRLRYDPNFPIRGLFLDKRLGNLLKVDSFGMILSAVHGRLRVEKSKLKEMYPNRVIRDEQIGRRYYLLDTLFTLPEACLYADLVNYFESRQRTVSRSDSEHGSCHGCREEQASPGEARAGAAVDEEEEEELDDLDDYQSVIRGTQISYANLFQDVRAAVDYVHLENSLKKHTVDDLPKYVRRDSRLPVLLGRMRVSGAKVFLLTNSEYEYTEKVMSYMLDGLDPQLPCWRDYFDIIIVNARKPLFFKEGTTLREVRLPSGRLMLSPVTERFERGKVYSGGSLETFREFSKCKGPDVLYIGDHIFSDILKSKKTSSWRTFLIVPELDHELSVWMKSRRQYVHLVNMEFIRAEMYRNLDSTSASPPAITDLVRHIRNTQDALDCSFNKFFGSLFRLGSKQTFFSMQVQRYADIYASDFLNLINYPFFYYFSAMDRAVAHEAEAMSQDNDVAPSPLGFGSVDSIIADLSLKS